jgi:hypothetical protein
MSDPVMSSRVEVLREVASGRLPAAEGAAKLGVTDPQFAQWLDMWAMSQEIAAQDLNRLRLERNRTVRRAAMTMAAIGAVTLGLWATQDAWAQVVCTQTLPSPLKTFCPNAPALASDVNGNFSTVATWLSTKTGTLGSLDLTTQDITARTATLSGNISLPTGNLSFGSTTRQMINLYSTDYGLGVQPSTTYVRTGGGFGVYRAGTHSNSQFDPGAGGTVLMTVDSSGNVSAAGNLQGAGIRQRDCQWQLVGLGIGADNIMHQVICSSNRYMAGWRCYAGDRLDGDCAAYCCLP